MNIIDKINAILPHLKNEYEPIALNAEEYRLYLDVTKYPDDYGMIVVKHESGHKIINMDEFDDGLKCCCIRI